MKSYNHRAIGERIDQNSTYNWSQAIIFFLQFFKCQLNKKVYLKTILYVLTDSLNHGHNKLLSSSAIDTHNQLLAGSVNKSIFKYFF